MNIRPGTVAKTATTQQAKPECPPRVSSSQLLGGRGVLIIEHEGREYRLQLTQNRKLILTA